jgi:hypothetical protein
MYVEYKRIVKVEPSDKGSNNNFEKQFTKKGLLNHMNIYYWL